MKPDLSSDDHPAVAMVREAYAAFNAQGVQGLEVALSPEIRWLESPEAVAVRRTPRSDVLARMEELRWDEWRMEPEKYSLFGNRLVVSVREVGPRDGPGDAERRRGHYWAVGPAGVERLEVHRSEAAALDAAVGYLALLERLHDVLRPRTYVEIGVGMGRSLGRARPGARLVGIDPAAGTPDPALAQTASVFALESDTFFAGHDLRSELGGLPVDLAFIDGMHLFEFALRDFVNIERHCDRNSVILVHDCWPLQPEHTEREPRAGAWTGDVWKLFPCLREQRPDLNVTVIGIRPTGLGIVTGLDPGSTVLRDTHAELASRYMALEWTPEAERPITGIDDDWETIAPLLPAPFDGAGAPVR